MKIFRILFQYEISTTNSRRKDPAARVDLIPAVGNVKVK